MDIMALVGYSVYDYTQKRGQKKAWRLPFTESIGIVDILVEVFLDGCRNRNMLVGSVISCYAN